MLLSFKRVSCWSEYAITLKNLYVGFTFSHLNPTLQNSWQIWIIICRKKRPSKEIVLLFSQNLNPQPSPGLRRFSQRSFAVRHCSHWHAHFVGNHLNEGIEGPHEHTFSCFLYVRDPRWLETRELSTVALTDPCTPYSDPKAVLSQPLFHRTLTRNSSSSPLSIKSSLPKQWLLFRKNNPSIPISETSWTSAKPCPAKSSWTSANLLLLKLCKIFHCPSPSQNAPLEPSTTAFC